MTVNRCIASVICLDDFLPKPLFRHCTYLFLHPQFKNLLNPYMSCVLWVEGNSSICISICIAFCNSISYTVGGRLLYKQSKSFNLIGKYKRVFFVVYAIINCSKTIRIISVRKANKFEKERYVHGIDSW